MDQTSNPVWQLRTHSLKWREGNEKDNRSLEVRGKARSRSSVRHPVLQNPDNANKQKVEREGQTNRKIRLIMFE